ncbi:methyltransferase domain-containing protein [Herbaspirillum sp. DW155]|uniref:class I SAM-dependent methyltransferase n=1 Tax=Herbaspirillum sp. DW155 TaxID=3095609 RepID=UPI00309147BD|nr:methyltransferase domain-containing protein [Herbaspirillum sp. DW155]
MTAASFFIKPGYQSRTQPEYYADIHDDGTVWQPEVYPLAATLARQHGCRYIIDIGCGRARKLSMMYPEFQIIGLDFGSNLEYCRANYPFGNWVEVDLENSDGVQFPPDVLQNAVVISSDVIEHLVNPTPLMALIRSYLLHAKVAVISTPERDLERGYQDMGPPGNPTHIREWNLAELEAMLSNAGLRPAYCGLTISNNREMQRKTSLAVVPGVSLNSLAVRDLGVFCERWLAASPEMREADNGNYLRDLAQLERMVEQTQVATQPLLAPMTPLEIGMGHIEAARYEEAFKVLTEALKTDGQNPAVVFQLGRLAAICNMNDDAKELFYQAALRAPEVVKDIVDFFQERLTRARAGLE